MSYDEILYTDQLYSFDGDGNKTPIENPSSARSVSPQEAFLTNYLKTQLLTLPKKGIIDLQENWIKYIWGQYIFEEKPISELLKSLPDEDDILMEKHTPLFPDLQKVNIGLLRSIGKDFLTRLQQHQSGGRKSKKKSKRRKKKTRKMRGGDPTIKDIIYDSAWVKRDGSMERWIISNPGPDTVYEDGGYIVLVRDPNYSKSDERKKYTSSNNFFNDFAQARRGGRRKKKTRKKRGGGKRRKSRRKSGGKSRRKSRGKSRGKKRRRKTKTRRKRKKRGATKKRKHPEGSQDEPSSSRPRSRRMRIREVTIDEERRRRSRALMRNERNRRNFRNRHRAIMDRHRNVNRNRWNAASNLTIEDLEILIHDIVKLRNEMQEFIRKYDFDVPLYGDPNFPREMPRDELSFVRDVLLEDLNYRILSLERQMRRMENAEED